MGPDLKEIKSECAEIFHLLPFDYQNFRPLQMMKGLTVSFANAFYPPPPLEQKRFETGW
jgi:hypothetical protein